MFLKKKSIISKETFIIVQKGMLFFFLIISGNYIGGLLSCRTKKLFATSMFAKHLIAMMSLYFFVVVSDSKLQQYNPVITLIGSLVLYIYFLCIAKVESKFFIIILIILTLLAFFQIYREYLTKKTDKELGFIDGLVKNNIDNIQLSLIVISLLITIIGLLVYIGMKKLEYKNGFRYKTFFLGKSECKNNLLGNIPKSLNKTSLRNHLYSIDHIIFFIKIALTT